MRLYVATTNAGKLRDFNAAAEAAGVAIEPLPGLKEIAAPVEDAETFESNARLKALYYSTFMPGAWVLADDSGLEVDALDGRPGVRSARFAEDMGAMDAAAGVDASNNAALLRAMTSRTDRAARYRCALAVARDGVVEAVSEGSVEGEVLRGPQGSGGFGYDPLLFVGELQCTMADAEIPDRLRLSHRGVALRALLERWKPT